VLRKSWIQIVVIAVVVYFGYPPSASAGEVELTNGYAHVFRDKLPILLAKTGTPVELIAGDQLHTSGQGEIRWRFGACGGRLSPNGFFELRQVIEGVEFWLSQGELEVACMRMTHIQTPEALIHLKPGLAQVKVIGGKTVVTVNKGSVELANLIYPEEAIALGTGEIGEVQQLKRPVATTQRKHEAQPDPAGHSESDVIQK